MTALQPTPITPLQLSGGRILLALFCASIACGSALALEAPSAVPQAFRSYDVDKNGELSSVELDLLRDDISGARRGIVARAPLSTRQAAQADGETVSAKASTARPMPGRAREAAAHAGSAQVGKAPAIELQVARRLALEKVREARQAGLQAGREVAEVRQQALESALASRRGPKVERHLSRQQREVEREAFLDDMEAYRYMSRFKSPPIKTPKMNFRPPTRQGVTRGKKRGSEYYTELLRRVGSRGRGGGGRYGGGGYGGYGGGGGGGYGGNNHY
jgi:hypothetical protein